MCQWVTQQPKNHIHIEFKIMQGLHRSVIPKHIVLIHINNRSIRYSIKHSTEQYSPRLQTTGDIQRNLIVFVC